MLIYGHDKAITEWVQERVPHLKDIGPCVAVGVPNRSMDRLLAGVVFHSYRPDFETMELSMAADSPMWARREVIRELLAYPFKQVGVWKVWTATHVDNKRALDVNLHIGFIREAVLAHQFGKNRHAVICRMTRDVFNKLYG